MILILEVIILMILEAGRRVMGLVDFASIEDGSIMPAGTEYVIKEHNWQENLLLLERRDGIEGTPLTTWVEKRAITMDWQVP